MTVLEQRFMETVPDRLHGIERKLDTLNGHIVSLVEVLNKMCDKWQQQ
jgi:hypothetical protein